MVSKFDRMLLRVYVYIQEPYYVCSRAMSVSCIARDGAQPQSQDTIDTASRPWGLWIVQYDSEESGSSYSKGKDL